MTGCGRRLWVVNRRRLIEFERQLSCKRTLIESNQEAISGQNRTLAFSISDLNQLDIQKGKSKNSSLQFLVDYVQFHTSVLSASFGSRVISNWAIFTITFYYHATSCHTR